MVVKDSLIYGFLVIKNHKLSFYKLYRIAKAIIFLFFEVEWKQWSRHTIEKI